MYGYGGYGGYGYGGYGMGGLYGLFDPTMILVLIGVFLSLAASAKVQSTFAKYAKVRSMSGLTGAEAAQKILHTAGIYDVTVQHVAGNLTDHYDPVHKVLRLSDSVFGQHSVAAIGVAAHECGHAIQHQKNYTPLKFRSSLVPVVNFSSRFSWLLIIIGCFVGSIWIKAGILLFTASVLFQLVTLPVEYNASDRALEVLDTAGIMPSSEIGGARKVLRAAGLTYVAAAAASILQLLRLIMIFGNRRSD